MAIEDKKRKPSLRVKGVKSESAPPVSTAGSQSIVPLSEMLPPNLLLLPISQTTLFPGMMVPVILPPGKLTKTVEHIMEGNGYVGVVLFKSASSAIAGTATGPTTSVTGLPVEGSVPESGGTKDDESFHPYGVAAKIVRKINLPDNQVSVLLQGVQRFEIANVVAKDPFYVASVKYLYEILERSDELEAMLRASLSQFKILSKDNPLISEEVKVAMVNIDGPGKLADFMASVLARDVADYQAFLAAADVRLRLQHLLVLLRKEHDVQSVQKKIQDEINQKVSTAQREFYLQEQLKLIQKELGGNSTDRESVVQKLRERLKTKKLTPEIQERINEEFEKLENLNEQSSEYSVSFNYLDWVTSLPWGIRSEENFDLTKAKRQLDEDHFGLREVKERILEFLAVRKLKKTSEGSILCFVGPPGTGKTSLGKSIASALERKFFRFSVGGMRDEAEIKGHRRTYVGAMPGKMIQGLKRVGTQNPVFLIDEVDKLGSSFASGGDPASALLELLDPEQNPAFLDHYLDIPFDCSEVFFITTANATDTIPPALLDRMEVIHLRGYTDNEKLHIAKEYLVPKQLKKNALKTSNARLTDSGLRFIISHYAREAGVRNLEKHISRLARKVAYRVATGRKEKVLISDPKQIEKWLGVPPFDPTREWLDPPVGVAVGLAWTQFGGETLAIEATAVPGKGGLVLTGSLGDVMKESGSIAHTFVRRSVKELGISEDYFEKHQLHVHVPAGAIPKDGPSAGVTLAAALYSLLSGKKIKRAVAMTGELTLTGKVLPVGGIQEKLLAARRSGIQTVLIPAQNDKDLREVEREIREGLKVVKIANIDEAIRFLFN